MGLGSPERSTPRPLATLSSLGAPGSDLPLVSAAGTETVDVHAPAQVRGLLGGNVTLQCHLQLLDSSVQVTQVTWMRRQPAGQPSSVAVYHPSRSPWYLDPERVEFVAAMSGGELRNASLVVSQLRVEDEANYTCQFATFPHGSRSASTRLDVIAQPQNTAEAQKVPPGLFTSESVPVARCVSTGGRPRARITWSPDLDGKVNKSEAPGPLPGTFTVTSLLTVAPSSQVDGKSVTCIVEHESLEEPDSLPVNLTVYYPPEVNISGYDGSWYLGQSKASLTCDVRSNPAPTHYHWSTTTGPLPPSAVAQGPQLLIKSVDKLINTTFICNVTNAIGTGQGELAVVLNGEELPGSSPTQL
ncbi:PREDICTED: poliovirus receptor [Propithecus coquereli]|uniref:poliovirus receptor n=1 Tax=Propithecus coquereli TaxID=379532 RepID=UPI00063F04DB|nr:PREDICTED: poliovirus receptor [Propithecus coquereli]